MGAGAIRCLLLAQSRHAQCADECPLLASDQPLLTNRDLLVHGLVTKPHSSRIMGSQPPPVGPKRDPPGGSFLSGRSESRGSLASR